MAWVTQDFKHNFIGVFLDHKDVMIYEEQIGGEENTISLSPKSSSDAHSWALMLRRAARRLEEIGKGLPDAP